MNSFYDIFISYKRDDGAQYARILQLELEKRGYKVFLDYEELKDGVFGDNIKEAIRSTPIFMMVLTPLYLERSMEQDSWVREEIELAINLVCISFQLILITNLQAFHVLLRRK